MLFQCVCVCVCVCACMHACVHVCVFADFEHGNAGYKKLSICFRVRSRSPFTFNRALSNDNQHQFPAIIIFCHKELHLRCCTGPELNI